MAEELQFHDHANLFPLIDTNSFDELRRDIRENGLIESITLLDGKILDGRNRYRAMRHIDPNFSPASSPEMFVQFGGKDALQFVVGKNLRRRHLNESQRAIIAAKISLATPGRNRFEVGMSTPKVARLMNISAGCVNEAKRAIKQRPDDVAAIVAGKARLGRHDTDTRRTLNVDVNREIADAFEVYCERKHCSLADGLREVIAAALEADKQAGCPDYGLPTVAKPKRKSPEGTAEKHKDILAEFNKVKSVRAAARNLGMSHAGVGKVVRANGHSKEAI